MKINLFNKQLEINIIDKDNKEYDSEFKNQQNSIIKKIKPNY